MNFIKKFFHILKSQSFTPISSDPYSTHVPVLVGLSLAHHIECIVEYGSGFNSTFLFLNKSIFPSVQAIDSYENYAEWYEKIRIKLNSNIINYIFVDGPMSSFVNKELVSLSDLVFIDDSYSASERALTIDSVVRCKPKLCVIHDFENLRYRWSCFRTGEKYYRFKSILPNVGILGSAVNFDTCKKIDAIVARYTSSVSNDSVAEWITIFRSEL